MSPGTLVEQSSRGRRATQKEILSILTDEKEMTERLQRMSSSRWTTDELFPFFFSVFLSFFTPLWFVCVESEKDVSVWTTAITLLLQLIKNKSVEL